MKIILDTCTFLWLCEGAPHLSEAARSLFQNPDNDIFLSCSSAWEISLKFTLGKLQLAEAPDIYIPRMRQLHQVETLAITEADTIRAGRLPMRHRDPFDRLLIGQALTQDCLLLTPDPLIAQYEVGVVW